MSKISMIAALSENNVIGRDNQLPWHISEDLKRFKKVTQGHPVIMGRKTFESIGKPLPGRLNIVISRNFSYNDDSVRVMNSLDDAISFAERQENLIPLDGEKEIFIIGGGQIFEQAISRADKLYLTIVHTTIDGHAFFPDYSMFTKKTFEQNGESNGYTYTFIELEK